MAEARKNLIAIVFSCTFTEILIQLMLSPHVRSRTDEIFFFITMLIPLSILLSAVVSYRKHGGEVSF